MTVENIKKNAPRQTVTLTLRESRLYEAGKMLGQMEAYQVIAENLRRALSEVGDDRAINPSVVQQIDAHVEKLSVDVTKAINFALETRTPEPDSLRIRAKRAILVMLGQ